MIILFRNTAVVVGRDPEPKDAEFIQQVKHWAQEAKQNGGPK